MKEILEFYPNDISDIELFGKLVIYAADILLLYPYHHDVFLKGQMQHVHGILYSEQPCGTSIPVVLLSYR